VVSGANYADSTGLSYSATLAQPGSSATYVGLSPYFGNNGYLPYLVNCTSAGTYSLVVNTTNTAGSVTTSLVVNGATVSSALVLAGGSAAGVSIILNNGPNEILFGNGTGSVNSATQGCTINSLTFN
jgi:hypothetical protein